MRCILRPDAVYFTSALYLTLFYPVLALLGPDVLLWGQGSWECVLGLIERVYGEQDQYVPHVCFSPVCLLLSLYL